MPKHVKTGQIRFVGASPMSFSELSGIENLLNLDTNQKAFVRAVGETVPAYLKAAKSLLAGKFAHLKAWAPPHFANPGHALAACCSEGVVIRYELGSVLPRTIVAGWLPGSLPEVASVLSQKLIRIRRDPSEALTGESSSIALKLHKSNPSTGETTILAEAGISFEALLNDPPPDTVPGAKPSCLLSIRNSLELQLLGEFLPIDGDSGRHSAQSFMISSLLRLPVGWDCIEVFPGTNLSRWNPEYAASWAELDILAGVVTQQFREAQLNNLDPNAEARRRLSVLLEDYKKLLESESPPEEALQKFLTSHPALLCPAHTRVWPKLSLGAHVTDFIFLEATGDYVMVELEKPTDPLFVKSGHPSHELTHARGQIQDWRRYLEDNLSTVQREQGLHNISSSPRSMIVIGRTRELSDENRRKRVTIENESPRLKILTYDDVLENARAVVENIMGPLWHPSGNTRIFYLPPGSAKP